jgi:signal transduction histidine kinase
MKLRWRLFAKYAVLIASLVSLTLIASGITSIWFSYEENQRQLVALQREKAIGAAARIEQYVKNIEHQLGWVTLSQTGTEIDRNTQRRFEYLKLLRQVPAITEVYWLDDTGKEQLRVSRLAMDVSTSDLDYANDPRFAPAKTGKTYYSAVYFRKDTEPYMTLARSLPAGGGGVVVAEVNLKFVWEVVSAIRVGKGGFSYVVNSLGALIAHPDISLVLQKTDLRKLKQVAGALSERKDVEDDRSPVASDLQGREVLSAHALIPTLEWAVFVELPLEEAFAPLYETIVRTGILLLVSVGISILATVYLARRLVQPIRAIQAGAERIGAGNLDQRIEVTTGDELETLGEQFNKMAADLKEFYIGLERKVEERTAELSEALEQQTAIAEILRVISSTPTDIKPVLEAVTRRAAQLCDAPDARLLIVEGQSLHNVAGFGEFSGVMETLPLTRGLVVGRAVLDHAVIHVEDLAAALDEYPDARAPQQQFGNRTTLAVPLVRENKAVGVMLMRRRDVRPFTQTQVELVKTFADQATIAIENVRLFNEIQDKSRQLEMANKHKSEFLANMSHELRTPLNAVIGFSEVLGERMFGDLNDKQAEYVSDIHDSGKHLLSLINDILDLSKVEAGRMELDVTTFDLPDAIRNSLTLIGERATRHGIEVKSSVDPAVGELNGDERKFKQILLNLLSNAVKFTPEGGSVTVTAHRVQDEVEISVADTGIGIAASDHAAVFEEFRQVGTDYTKKAQGTGLGLALTRKFVELHGGRIWVNSEPGKGATFTFTLPMAQTPAMALAAG